MYQSLMSCESYLQNENFVSINGSKLVLNCGLVACSVGFKNTCSIDRFRQ